MWVAMTIALWALVMLCICVLRTCSHRQRRHAFLNANLKPLLARLGLKHTFGDVDHNSSDVARSFGDVEHVGSTPSRGHVFCTTASEQPPSYHAGSHTFLSFFSDLLVPRRIHVCDRFQLPARRQPHSVFGAFYACRHDQSVSGPLIFRLVIQVLLSPRMFLNACVRRLHLI